MAFESLANGKNQCGRRYIRIFPYRTVRVEIVQLPLRERDHTFAVRTIGKSGPRGVIPQRKAWTVRQYRARHSCTGHNGG